MWGGEGGKPSSLACRVRGIDGAEALAGGFSNGKTLYGRRTY